MKLTVKMTAVKHTKGTYVYSAADEQSDAVVPTLYVRKTAFGKGEKVPEHITITIEDGHNE